MDSTQSDVMFNLLSLKRKLFPLQKQCNNCHQMTNKWMIIGVCHHFICPNCIKVEDTICPTCRATFNPMVHVITSPKLKKEFNIMEDIVLEILALKM